MTVTHHDVIQSAIEAVLQTDLAASEPGIPVHFQGTKFTDPTGPWMFIAIVPGVDKLVALGGKEYKATGVVNVSCMVPADGRGTKKAKQLAGSVFTSLAGRQIPLAGTGMKSVSLWGAQYRDRGEINGWQTVNVLVPYKAYVTLQRA